MAKKASVDKLNALHDLLATYYSELLSEAIEDGEVLSSGTLAALNAFLKNNDISCDIIESEPMADLQAKFRALIESDEVVA